MSYTAPSVRKLDVGVGTDHQVLCSEFAKIATELGNDQALASGKIIVGNASGVATDVTMSGDATLSNAGALTIAAEAVTLAKMADLTRGSLISGQTTDNRPTALDAKGSGKILVGDGTDLASVAVSGDATLASTGALTIAAEAVTVAKMADLARGSILTGQTADNRPAALDAKTSGKILVGNGTDLVSVAVSGDATLASTGALTIASGAVEESMLAAANTEGLHAARVARAVYDFSVDGGIIGDIALGATLPDKARVTRSWCEVITPLTSATNAATVAISIPENDVAGIFAAIAINDVSNPWAVGIHVGIQDGVIANISEKCTAARALTMTIDVEALMAGKIVFFAEYVVSA